MELEEEEEGEGEEVGQRERGKEGFMVVVWCRVGYYTLV